MSYQAKTTWQSNTAGSFTSGSNTWTGQEVEDTFINLSDSIQWIDGKATITYASSFTYNCNNGSLQEITLTGNATMSVSNAVAGSYYTLIVNQDGTGGRTLTLPTSEYSNGGSIGSTASQKSIVSFLYDGTDYFFNVSSYTTT